MLTGPAAAQQLLASAHLLPGHQQRRGTTSTHVGSPAPSGLLLQRLKHIWKLVLSQDPVALFPGYCVLQGLKFKQPGDCGACQAPPILLLQLCMCRWLSARCVLFSVPTAGTRLQQFGSCARHSQPRYGCMHAMYFGHQDGKGVP